MVISKVVELSNCTTEKGHKIKGSVELYDLTTMTKFFHEVMGVHGVKRVGGRRHALDAQTWGRNPMVKMSERWNKLRIIVRGRPKYYETMEAPKSRLGFEEL